MKKKKLNYRIHGKNGKKTGKRDVTKKIKICHLQKNVSSYPKFLKLNQRFLENLFKLTKTLKLTSYQKNIKQATNKLILKIKLRKI